MKFNLTSRQIVQANRPGKSSRQIVQANRPGKSSRQIVQAIEKAGWYHIATHGDHWQFKHPTKPGKITVPHPKKCLPPDAVLNIVRQAGMTKEEFQEWLKK